MADNIWSKLIVTISGLASLLRPRHSTPPTHISYKRLTLQGISVATTVLAVPLLSR
jgi:hypothetical protein